MARIAGYICELARLVQYPQEHSEITLTGQPMPRTLPDHYTRSLSKFRSNAAGLLAQLRQTKRPLVLTQGGHSAAVVLEVGEYDRLQEQVELLLDIQMAQYQLSQGQGLDNETARGDLLGRFKP